MRLPDWLDTPLRTLAALVVLPGLVLVYSLAASVVALAGGRSQRLQPLYVGFSRRCLRMAGTHLEVHGAGHLARGQACIVVANHSSAWDPVCIIAGLPHTPIRFVVKKEIMAIPIFGHALRLTGNVHVKRAHTPDDVARIRASMEHREPEVCLLFFAEGTRSRDGVLQPFKAGAFATAIIHGLPVLPVAVVGAREIWPKGTLQLRRGVAVLEVGELLPVEGLRFEDRAALRERAREEVARLMARGAERRAALERDPAQRT